MLASGRRWPLTMFLTPTGRLFRWYLFSQGAALQPSGFPRCSSASRGIYREQRDEIGRQNETILATFESMQPGGLRIIGAVGGAHRRGPASLKTDFDSRYGGLAGRPVPAPAEPRILPAPLRRGRRRRGKRVATTTLERMALGASTTSSGRVSRVRVDAQWQIPHFEKMLYDNGPLLRCIRCLDRHAKSPFLRGSPKRPRGG